MKVAHVLRKYDPRQWAGTETALRHLAGGLRSLQVDSVIYAPAVQGVAFSEDALARDGHEVRRFRSFVPMLGMSEETRQRYITVGGNIMSLDLPWHLMREPDLAVMHTHVLNRLGGIARLVAKRRKIPFVVTIHGGYLDLPEDVKQKMEATGRAGFDYGRMFGALVGSRRVLQDADAIVVFNPREAELLKKRFPRHRVEVMPHGIPVSKFSKDHRTAAEQYLPAVRDKKLILSVARIDSTKNQKLLVDALPQLHLRHPDAALVLVGAETDEGYTELLRGRVAELGLQDHVHWAGFLPPGDPRLLGLYQAASVFALTSDAEPFGIVLLEAWASKTAVVATRTSGAQRLVEPGADGWLIECGSLQQLLEALDSALSDPQETARLAEQGRCKVLEQFDVPVMANRVKGLYEELLKASRTGG